MRRPEYPTQVMSDTHENKMSYEGKRKCMEKAPNQRQNLDSVGQVVSALCNMGKLFSLSEPQVPHLQSRVFEGLSSAGPTAKLLPRSSLFEITFLQLPQ